MSYSQQMNELIDLYYEWSMRDERVFYRNLDRSSVNCHIWEQKRHKKRLTK